MRDDTACIGRPGHGIGRLGEATLIADGSPRDPAPSGESGQAQDRYQHDSRPKSGRVVQLGAD